MALGIMIAGLLTAVSGTVLAVALGLDLGFALVVYGVFGVFGGVIASLPILRNVGRHGASNNRTLG